MLQQLDLTILNKFLHRISTPFANLIVDGNEYYSYKEHGFFSFYHECGHIIQIIADSDLAFEHHQKIS